jgi:polar amino acid transport system substrate-binding protein
MKKIIISTILTFCFNLSAIAFAADINVEVYADEGYPPYSYKENGKAKGIYARILKKAFSRMKGYKVKIKPVPWKRGLSYLKNGKGFALYPPYFHTNDRPYIWPYSIPILDEKVVVFCREEILARPRPKWPEDYYGLRIGNNSGFKIGGKKFWKAVKEGKIKLQEAKTTTQNIIMLGVRRTDCYINDRLSILWKLKQLKAAGKYEEAGRHAKLLEGATISIEQGFLGFTDKDKGKFPFKDDFVKKFDTIIYEMRKNGELQRIVNDFTKNMFVTK